MKTKMASRLHLPSTSSKNPSSTSGKLRKREQRYRRKQKGWPTFDWSTEVSPILVTLATARELLSGSWTVRLTGNSPDLIFCKTTGPIQQTTINYLNALRAQRMCLTDRWLLKCTAAFPFFPLKLHSLIFLQLSFLAVSQFLIISISTSLDSE